MQLSPGALRIKIKDTTGKEKRTYISALLLRDIALLTFAILYITLFVKFFGQANSSVAVASFCMIISMHFVGLGFKVSHSVLALAVVLTLMFAGGLFWFILPPELGFIANFISLLTILLLTSSKPELGNAGVYAFGYIFVTGMTVTGSLSVTRGMALVTVWVILSAILVLRHRAADHDVSVKQVIHKFSVHSVTTQWQLRLAFGISLVLAIADNLNFNRPVWLGYACMSILLQRTPGYIGKSCHRITGVILGTILFTLCMTYLPTNLLFFLAPLGGFGIGLTMDYFLQSVFNCFGALTLATSLYGVQAAGMFRIIDNLAGIAVALICVITFELIWRLHKKHCRKKAIN